MRKRAALDLRDDRGAARDLGVADDPGAELGADDALVEELGPARELARALEEREAGGGSAPARRAVDLAVGEHGHVALAQGRAEVDPLPEDDPVDVPQLVLLGWTNGRCPSSPAFTARPSSISSGRFRGLTGRGEATEA